MYLVVVMNQGRCMMQPASHKAIKHCLQISAAIMFYAQQLTDAQSEALLSCSVLVFKNKLTLQEIMPLIQPTSCRKPKQCVLLNVLQSRP